jgi:hypothetical protein
MNAAGMCQRTSSQTNVFASAHVLKSGIVPDGFVQTLER